MKLSRTFSIIKRTPWATASARASARRRLLRWIGGWVGCAFALAVTGAGTVHAATEVSGVLVADTVWSASASPYVVTADVTVSEGAVLSIGPGVMVLMSPATSLIVGNGSLRALGTAEAPIVMTSSKDDGLGGSASAGDWEQLVFRDASDDAGTQLAWVQVRYGKGVRIESASPRLDRLSLWHNAGPAISMDLKSSPTGDGLQATGNGLNGISVPAGEIDGVVQWRLRGIPYVVEQGEVSIGKRAVITGISPDGVQQGQAVDAVISGSRLSGAENIVFDNSGLSAVVGPGGSDSSIPVRITASASLPLGRVGFTLQVAAGTARYEKGVEVIALKPLLSVSGIMPSRVRRLESKSFVVTGENLQGAQVSAPAGSGLSVGNLQTSPTQATFVLAASASAALGAQTLSVSNPQQANGIGTVSVAVDRALPRVFVSPSPLAVAPDGSEHAFLIRFTNSDDAAHTLALAVGDPSMVAISPTTIVVPAGETQASVNMTGLKLGYTTLYITSPTLAPVSVGIYVTNTLSGEAIGPILSPLVGVTRPVDSSSLPTGTSVGPIVSPRVGVARPADASTLPVGTNLGPVISRVVGVARPVDLSGLPVGTSLGPVISPPVGVARPQGAASLPEGTSVGPVVSPQVGVDWPEGGEPPP
jgi:hypothetical protein